MTTAQPIIRYDAIIEAWLNGTLRRTFAADDKRPAAGSSTTLRKTIVSAREAAAPSGTSVLINRDEANLLARQACQRAEHAKHGARTRGIEFGTNHASADRDTVALFRASRLHRFVPGFYAGVR